MIAICANAEGNFIVPANCKIVTIEINERGAVIWLKPVIRVKAGRRVLPGRSLAQAKFEPVPFEFMEE